MPINRWEWREQQHIRKKASKTADRTHLTYCWLRADQASVQLGQLQRSHELTPVVIRKDLKPFNDLLWSILYDIEVLKGLIKNYQEHLKKQAGKK